MDKEKQMAMECAMMYKMAHKLRHEMEEYYKEKGVDEWEFSDLFADIMEYEYDYETFINKINTPKEYTVNFAADVDITISAYSPQDARERAKKAFGEYHDKGFEYAYISEIRGVRDENGNEV